MKKEHFMKLFILVGVSALFPMAALAGDGHEHGNEKEEAEEGGEHGHGEEGIVQLSEEAVTNSKIEIRDAGPATLAVRLRVNGRISPVSSNVAHIASRFAGVIREVKKDIGETVEAGDVLAIIESNQNLQKFEVRAFKGGIVTDRHATIGESIKEDEALFVVMDLSQLWADFTIFQRDIAKVKIGQAVNVYISGRAEPFKSTLSFISPIVDDTTQSRTARAVITNPDNTLAPGAFVTGQVAIADYQVPVAVTYEGIQTIEGKSVVFTKDEDGFEKKEVSVGRSDETYSEILSGIKEGEKYAATNSFILKAELGKSEAEHEH
ncbi:MAG TPA: efflux RND transporter periplasmic adaptor subunit [Oligoflexia bacterium]|nr:efflux RND transporter periplasmic adaptor subunit [Oligoflexia bacterium]HMP27350.1 efflux RND transporter periplasmic adaptor subunit [Oligoflexia bacterium]